MLRKSRHTIRLLRRHIKLASASLTTLDTRSNLIRLVTSRSWTAMLIYITRKSLSRTASITQSPVITMRIKLNLPRLRLTRRYVAARCQCLATYGSPPVGRVPSNVIVINVLNRLTITVVWLDYHIVKVSNSTLMALKQTRLTINTFTICPTLSRWVRNISIQQRFDVDITSTSSF